MIPRDYLDTWNDDAHGPSDADWLKNATLIDTFAHEMTHLLAVRKPPTEVAVDGGFSMHPCKMGKLVSYKSGHLAKCVALGKNGRDLSSCMTDLHRDMRVPPLTNLWNWTRRFCDSYPEK
jgi:hypothetical protein